MAKRFNPKIPVVAPPKPEEPAIVYVTELAAKDFEAEVAGAPGPVVLDFYGAGSKSCEELAPRLAAVAEKFAGRVRFVKLKRQENAALATKLGVTSHPTLLFFKGGKDTGVRLSGDDIKRTAVKAQVEAMLA